MTSVLTRRNRSVSFGVFRLQHESYPLRSVKNRSGRNYNTGYTRTLLFRTGVGNLPAREINPKAPEPTRMHAVAHRRMPRAALSLRGAIATWQHPGKEMKTIVHAYPKHLPAVAHRRTPRSEAENYVTRNGKPRDKERRVAAKRITFATCCLAERT